MEFGASGSITVGYVSDYGFIAFNVYISEGRDKYFKSESVLDILRPRKPYYIALKLQIQC